MCRALCKWPSDVGAAAQGESCCAQIVLGPVDDNGPLVGKGGADGIGARSDSCHRAPGAGQRGRARWMKSLSPRLCSNRPRASDKTTRLPQPRIWSNTNSMTGRACARNSRWRSCAGAGQRCCRGWGHRGSTGLKPAWRLRAYERLSASSTNPEGTSPCSSIQRRACSLGRGCWRESGVNSWRGWMAWEQYRAADGVTLGLTLCHFRDSVKPLLAKAHDTGGDRCRLAGWPQESGANRDGTRRALWMARTWPVWPGLGEPE